MANRKNCVLLWSSRAKMCETTFFNKETKTDGEERRNLTEMDTDHRYRRTHMRAVSCFNFEN